MHILVGILGGVLTLMRMDSLKARLVIGLLRIKIKDAVISKLKYLNNIYDTKPIVSFY